MTWRLREVGMSFHPVETRGPNFMIHESFESRIVRPSHDSCPWWCDDPIQKLQAVMLCERNTSENQVPGENKDQNESVPGCQETLGRASMSGPVSTETDSCDRLSSYCLTWVTNEYEESSVIGTEQMKGILKRTLESEILNEPGELTCNLAELKWTRKLRLKSNQHTDLSYRA